jgi:hypothetical protein
VTEGRTDGSVTISLRNFVGKGIKGCTRLAAASDKVYQLLAHGWWFSPGTSASSTTKTGRHDIAEILLKVALNTKNQNQIKSSLNYLPFIHFFITTTFSSIFFTFTFPSTFLTRTTDIFTSYSLSIIIFYLLRFSPEIFLPSCKIFF